MSAESKYGVKSFPSAVLIDDFWLQKLVISASLGLSFALQNLDKQYDRNIIISCRKYKIQKSIEGRIIT